MACNFKLVFNRDNRLNKNGEGLIQIEVYFNRSHRKLLNTHKHITPDLWDSKNNQVDSKHKNAIKLNQYFKNIINDLENFELECYRLNKPFNWQVLKAYFKSSEPDNTSALTFYQYALNYIENNNKLAPGTKRHNKCTLNLFNQYFKDIRFDEHLREVSSSDVSRIRIDGSFQRGHHEGEEISACRGEEHRQEHGRDPGCMEASRHPL